MSDNPDFAKIAEASGAAGIVIDSEENLQSGIEEAFAINDRPVVIHVKVRKDDNVFPFIPAGGAYSEMQTGPSNVKLAQPKGST
jgi:acetolactate synthase-1/2/3 large subunit